MIQMRRRTGFIPPSRFGGGGKRDPYKDLRDLFTDKVGKLPVSVTRPGGGALLRPVLQDEAVKTIVETLTKTGTGNGGKPIITMPKNKPKYQSQVNVKPSVGGGVTQSFFRAKSPKERKVIKDAVKTATLETFSDISSTLISATSGTQSINEIYPWINQQVKNKLFEQLAGENPDGSINSANYDRKFYFRKYYQKTLFTNTDVSTCFLDIYICKPRNSTFKSPATIWKAAFGATLDSSSDESVYGTAEAWSIPFVTPFTCRSLCQEYRIVKKIRVEILQGQTHRFTMVIPFHRVVTGRQLADEITSDGYLFIPRDYIPLVVVYGSPVHSSSAPSTVSLSKVNLDTVVAFGAVGAQIGFSTSQQINKKQISTIASGTEQTLSPGAGEQKTD